MATGQIKQDKEEIALLQFSLSLYDTLDKDGNVCMSPYSVSAALMLLLLGTDGKTKSQLASALFVGDLNERLVHSEYSHLQKTLAQRSGNGLVISIANRIFSKKGVVLEDTYNSDALKYYGSEVEQLDFAKQTEESRVRINSWIEEHTGNIIKNLIPPNMINMDTMMVLTNAIYFKGEWNLKFDATKTSKNEFFINETDSVEVNMMVDKRKAMSGIFEELGCKCLELPYKGDKISMLVLLPNEKSGLESLEKKINNVSVYNMISSKLKEQITIILMPKLEIEKTFDLTRILPKIGITDIFHRNADFSRMFENAENFSVSGVIHKTFVQVNEEGSEAAAATAIFACPTSVVIRPSPFEFVADHPFLFFIREIESGTILFVGRFASPMN